MSRLSDLLNGQPVSARQAAARAEDEGIPLPYGTIAAYWSGKHGRPSAKTLERLAAVLPLSIGQLQKAAWGKETELGEYTPPREADLLDHRQRRAVDELIRSIVAAQEARHEDQGTKSTPSTTPVDGETGIRRAPMSEPDVAWPATGVDVDDPSGVVRRLLSSEPLPDAELEEPLPYDPEELHAAREVPGPSKGQWLRDQQDQDAESGDAEGPEGGA